MRQTVKTGMKRIYKKIKENRIIIAIIILAAMLRIIALFFAPTLIFDAVDFDELGKNLAEGKGYTIDGIKNTPYIGIRAPGYPVFISTLYFTFGYNHYAVYIAQILMDIAIVLMLFLLTKRVMKKKEYGYIAAAFWAVNPMSIYYTVSILSEMLFIFLLALGAFLFIEKVYYEKKPGYFLAVSAIYGYISLIKTWLLPVYIFLLLTFIYLIYLQYRHQRPNLTKTKSAKSSLIILMSSVVLFIVISSAFSIRNYYVFDHPVSNKLAYSKAFVDGNYNLFTADELKEIQAMVNNEFKNLTPYEAVEVAEKLMVIDKQRIMDKPMEYAQNVIIRGTLFWIEPFGIRAAYLLPPDRNWDKAYTASLTFVLTYGFIGFFTGISALQLTAIIIVLMAWITFLAISFFGLYLMYFKHKRRVIAIGILLTCLTATGVYALTVSVPRYFIQNLLVLMLPFSLGSYTVFVKLKKSIKKISRSSR